MARVLKLVLKLCLAAGLSAATLLAASCVSRPVTLDAMLVSMAHRKSLPDSHYDRLWYQGTEDGWHYFKHIRGYFLPEAYYRIKAKDLSLSASWPYSTNSDDWAAVEFIGSRWHAEDKDEMTGQWAAQSCPGYWRCVNIALKQPNKEVDPR